jgi:hypothetical protein
MLDLIGKNGLPSLENGLPSFVLQLQSTKNTGLHLFVGK